MKPIIYGVAVLLLAGFSLSHALDDNPINALGTQTRNALGSAIEAPQENPALLGVDRVPRCGLMVAPLSNFAAGLWSDKLGLSPSYQYWMMKDERDVSGLASTVIRNSFGLDKNSSTQHVSDVLTDKLAGGLTVYSSAKATVASFAYNRIGFDITTHIDGQAHIPEGPLFAAFSTTKGLQRGNTLDFSDIRADGLWTTDFTFNIGLPVTVPALNNFFKLRYGAGGLGIKYIMGHSVFHAQADNGSMKYDPVNGWVADGNLTVQTAGAGFRGPWGYDNPFKDNILPPVTGHGIGIDLGGILYDETGAMTINFKDLGVVFWLNQVRTVTYKVHTTGMDMYDIVSAIDSFGNNPRAVTKLFQKQGGYISDSTNDSLVNGNGFATMLPLRLNIGYARTFDLASFARPYLAKYANVSADYDQGFNNAPGNSFIPRLSIGGEAGALSGYVPVRMGFVLGGRELFASAAGFGLNFKYFQFNAAYKAVGTMYFVPTNGIEVAAGMGFNWGMTLPSKSVATVVEYDRDHDGIPDSLDRCPDVSEDKDGFEDADGCPDYDNDNDGIADSLDQCPNLAGTRENEGCPVFDQDRDGIPDSLDRCPKEPENYNGYMDEDGCSDAIMKADTLKPSVKEMEVLNTKLHDINFKTASSELLPVSFSALDYAVSFLHQYPNLKYEIQGHTDSRGGDDYNLLLSAARANSVRSFLLAKGIPDSSLIAIGYGKMRPIATNNTAAGRALNRRVEFRYVQEAQEYSALKIQESIFRDRIREAKLKGAKY